MGLGSAALFLHIAKMAFPQITIPKMYCHMLIAAIIGIQPRETIAGIILLRINRQRRVLKIHRPRSVARAFTAQPLVEQQRRVIRMARAHLAPDDARLIRVALGRL